MIDLLDLTLLAPPFELLPAVVIPEPTATFLEALRTRLLETDGLEELADVYLTTSPPAADFPFLVMNRLWESPAINASRSYYKEVEMQFDVFSQDDVEATEIGEAAYDGLVWDSSAPDPLLFARGYEMARFQGDADGPTTDGGGGIGGDAVWRYRFNYTFLVGKD
jgi:hypothetical protein